MEEQDNLKTLLGGIDYIPEVDDEENEEMVEDAIKSYFMLEILNSVGEENLVILNNFQWKNNSIFVGRF